MKRGSRMRTAPTPACGPADRPPGGGVSVTPTVAHRSTRPASILLAVALAVVVVAASVALVLRLTGDGEDDTASPPVATTTPTVPSTDTPFTATPGTSVAPSTELSAEQVRTVDELKEQVSEIRGLEWKADLPIRIVAPGELSQRLRDLTAIERRKHADDLAAVDAVLKLLQLIPRDIDYATTIDKVLAGGVLGFYDDETKELFVGGDPDSDLDVATQSTMVHELTHALTDQNFAFGDRNRALGDEDRAEESYSLAALVEGDAELVRTLWSEKHLSSRERSEAMNVAGVDPSVYRNTPPYLLESLSFPYGAGHDFVSALHDEGGFAAVDAAYRQPPSSTEEILHPDLYLPGRSWTRPTLPDLAAATGCTVLDTSTIGEFDMIEVLDMHLPAAEARKAAGGWNGDAYGLVRCGTAFGMADRWRADSAGDLTELADSLGRWARAWSGSDRAPDADGKFSGPSGSGRILRTGDRVDLVIADDASTSDLLAAAVLAA